MTSSSKTRDCSGDSDDGISDDDSLDVTLEHELAGGMNLTQDDEFLNLLCDDDKLASKFSESLGNEEQAGWSSSVTDAEMSYPEDDEQGIGVEFIVHNPMTKWSLMQPTEKKNICQPSTTEICFDQLRGGKRVSSTIYKVWQQKNTS